MMKRQLELRREETAAIHAYVAVSYLDVGLTLCNAENVML
jgi:hypothetical protein